MIDTNVHLFRWPFRRLPGDEPAELVARLKQKGVRQAWAGNFEALYCRDISGVNARLAAVCREQAPGFFVPFGCINPKLPDWEEDLRRCCEDHRMVGIRLYPNYHRYTLEDGEFVKLLSLAEKRKLIVQIALSMEDTRTQYPWMIVQPVDPKPLSSILAKLPTVKLVLLNSRGLARNQEPEISAILKSENVCFDLANNEGIGGLEELIAATSPDRVVFGSHAPFYYFESALLRVQEALLTIGQSTAVTEGNAQRLMAS